MTATRPLLPLAAALLLAACGGGSTATPAPQVDPPRLPDPVLAATTAGPAAITKVSARLQGSVATGTAAASAWFEWGSDPALATSQATAPVALEPNLAATAVSAALSGLDPGTTYWYRAVASDAGGTVRGALDYFATSPASADRIVVNTADDLVPPPPGKVTLRAAVAQVSPGGTVAFHPVLDGKTIRLTHVGEPHTLLMGEVFMMAGGKWAFLGYEPRDYGASAIFVQKAITVDASELPGGVTIAWEGDEPARVLAAYGDLTLDGVTVRGGRAVAEPLDGAQAFTLARGGGLAVWGLATIRRSAVTGNAVEGDLTASRDRGAFGGGVYADRLLVEDSVVAGNTARGYGAAGGGVYVVNGAREPSYGPGSELRRSGFTGNRVTAQHAYGGGVFTEGGGPGNMQPLVVDSCTIARNLVEDHPGIAEDPRAQYYYRGGGLYMSNGWLTVTRSTIAENAVTGHLATFSGKPNMGGGALAATVGDAHVVESIELQATIAVGNTVNGAPADVFTGSVIDFFSSGYNLLGTLDRSQLLVPVGCWWTLSRLHAPHVGDVVGVTLGDALDLGGAAFHPTAVSAGTDAGAPALLWYPPGPAAAGALPTTPYSVASGRAGYDVIGGVDDFLEHVVTALRLTYPDELGPDFGATLPEPSGIVIVETPYAWPSDPANAAYIAWWRALEAEIGPRLGPAGLAEAFWDRVDPTLFGPNVSYDAYSWLTDVLPPSIDQRGNVRTGASIGAVE